MTDSRDPASDPALLQKRMQAEQKAKSWNDVLQTMSPYARLNEVVRYQIRLKQHATWSHHAQSEDIPSLWAMEKKYMQSKYPQLFAEKQKWLDEQVKQIQWMLMPLIRNFHWEEDVGGNQNLNQKLPWWELTRVNRKDLMAA